MLGRLAGWGGVVEARVKRRGCGSDLRLGWVPWLTRMDPTASHTALPVRCAAAVQTAARAHTGEGRRVKQRLAQRGSV